MPCYIYLFIYALLNLIIKLIWSEIKVHIVLLIFNSWIKHMEYLPQTGQKTISSFQILLEYLPL